MRVRVKFTKTGSMKYIGHLDVMRFFQKVIRRAGLDAAYSEGFSPHMLMSFAQPLSVGVTSTGEYFDLDLKSASSSEEMMARMNRQMPDECRVTGIVQIPEDKANKCMSLVAAADYRIVFSPDGDEWEQVRAGLEDFLRQEEIPVVKKTKKNETVMDIRPLIYDWEIRENELDLRLSCGSVNNVKPQLVMQAFLNARACAAPAVPFAVHRQELLAETKNGFAPLGDLGRVIPPGLTDLPTERGEECGIS